MDIKKTKYNTHITKLKCKINQVKYWK